MYKQKNKRYKIIALVLCVAMLFSATVFVPTTHAWWGIVDFSLDIPDTVVNAAGTVATVAGWVWEYAKYALELLKGPIIVAAKIAALYAIQEAVAMITGDDAGGSNTMIRDFGNYLFDATKQKALADMNLFFTSVSNGRISSLNYEGVTGKNVDAYMAQQAKKVLETDDFVTSIRDVVPDPQSDLFSSGNMKGLMEYMKCPNNIACYIQTAEKQYATSLDRAQQIASKETVDGFLPIKDILTGRIKTPADLTKWAVNQVDAEGQELIMSAASDEGASLSGSLTQIAAGAALSIASRAINYGITDNEGDQIASSIRSGDGTFTLSKDYATLGTSATTVKSTATYTDAQLLKTCSSLNLLVDKGGPGMTINGNWVECRIP